MKGRIVVLLISLVLTLLIADHFAGVYIEKKFSQGKSFFISRDEGFRRCFNLSDKFEFEPEWGECGLLDIDKEIARRNDPRILGASDEARFRILALGDSATFRSDYPRLMEEKLNLNQGESDLKFEVVKVGVEAYNTAQEFELLRSKAIDFNPDMVLLQFHLNDFDFTPIILNSEDGFIYFNVKGERIRETNSWLFKQSNLYKLFVLTKLTINHSEKSSEFWEERESFVRESLIEIREFLSERDIPLLVAVFPIFAEEQWEPNREKALSIFEEEGIEFVDLLPAMEASGGAEEFAVKLEGQRPDVLHPSGEASELIAEELAKLVHQKHGDSVN